EVRLKSKSLWKNRQYGEAISYYWRYLLMKALKVNF
ncbi:TPA: glycosyltransferase family 8 protein, partial [Citrobacter farmeri]|nr:glycosyltransferase family 8 protein [Citrobacter farmeri]HBZ9439095.1 glycosyltransferase family 8 protein [Citrobacter farmeri]